MMNYFAPVIGENGMTSNEYMSGYFLPQEALGSVGIPRSLTCPGFALY